MYKRQLIQATVAMAIYKQKRVLSLILGLLCLAYVFLLDHSDRQQWVLKKMADGRQPTKLEDPLQYPSETDCYPYFRELHVQPVPQYDCDKPYVSITIGKYLGNKMCQYASLYLLRHLFGVRVSILNDMYTTLDKIFKNITLPIKKLGCFKHKPKEITYLELYDKLYRTAAQVRSNTSSNLITEPLLKTSYHIKDYPGPRDLFLEHRKLIQSLFKFRDKVLENATRNINNALKSFNATYHQRDFPIVTVHVRRTDYTRHLKNRMNLTQLDKLYYNNAFEFYKKRLKRPLFLVVSDDPEWCREMLQAEDVLIIASEVKQEDMAAMSLGDHHIISYGTFSFTGALLGNGNITHPLTTNPRYRLVKCVKSPVFYNVDRGDNQQYSE
ncbi:galactoside 2-alpha-L-fucosyltransferase SEC1-like [Portunus trituberculatus]|uniref:galactoside 2-alpha-L-fucosyltransferase SEC1-like n=2 Tax=Portunus trituberculatus TaxID=210409 RepID=UPI001E1D0349|nr:galactoside 2-alpha-L-fucosyltransferase SEC1-like [Portunus trituberculatus]XP_045109723.1 galactoside 2-alpha-L-fucosyltransferase SEC1-like [Portunus trituberculatus]XP_045109815.1 galactoside 2-alpha-L-fucosyltransferase SEC1-like [Portunus trituberculatus]